MFFNGAGKRAKQGEKERKEEEKKREKAQKNRPFPIGGKKPGKAAGYSETPSMTSVVMEFGGSETRRPAATQFHSDMVRKSLILRCLIPLLLISISSIETTYLG